MNDAYQRILRALVHLQTHLDDDVSLRELARIAAYSPPHFHRVFRGMVGETVMAHVRRLRLERAAQRLIHTATPLIRVALDAGYDSQEAFTRAFQRAFGSPPGRFRELRRPALPAPSGVHYDEDGVVDGFEPVTEESRNMEITVKTRPQCRALFVRHIGPYDLVGETWEALMEFAALRGLVDGESLMLGSSHDDPAVTPRDKLRYDACLTISREVADRVQLESPVGLCDLAGGEYAVALHEGPYQNLDVTYSAVFGQWMPTNDREPRDGPCLEHYLNEPGTTEPDDLLTEVWVPLSPASREVARG